LGAGVLAWKLTSWRCKAEWCNHRNCARSPWIYSWGGKRKVLLWQIIGGCIDSRYRL